MGKHHQEFLKQKEAKETMKRRLVRAGAGLVVTAAGVVGAGIVTSEDALKSPQEIVELIQAMPSAEEASEILNHKYNEVLSAQVGEHNLTIAEIGAVEQPLDYEAIQSVYEEVSAFVESSPAFGAAPFISYDSNDQIVDNLMINYEINPVGKDVNLFVVPEDINIGTYQGFPNVFTEVRGEEVASFVRPDVPNAYQGVVTEICQGLVGVELSNPEQVPLEDRDAVRLVIQEQVCNSLSRAIGASRDGTAFETYQSSQMDTQTLFTDQVVQPGTVGYASTMPYVGSRTAYESIATNIPQNYAEELVHPPAPVA